ncbi:MAG: rRNA maturation RNase YbeY [Burkholderiaceae bacterium]|nr:rRNA maturation RNase YbeY [Burkholderiaceae bacterium]
MPRLSLQIQADPDAGTLPADRRRIRRWVAAALERDAELVLRFVGAAEGRELNRHYRDKDRPTNVLTFPYESEPVTRADIVVCLPVVRAEALAQRKREIDHLAHLVVHGVLHAQGHDHEREPQASHMEAREVAILHRFGIADPYA